MKSLELNALGLEEMSLEESKQTNGGIIPLLILAAAALLVTGCTVQVNIENGDGDQHVGDEHGSGDEIEGHIEVIPC